MKLTKNAKNAIYIGTLCSIAYLAVYIARNILSAVTPKMLETGDFTEEYIGRISSVYFMFYAFGQLINGVIGDKIKAKYMMCLGLLLAGVASVVFPMLIAYRFAALVSYAMTGFFLAMIYGPMTKMVSENTEPLHAVRCSLAYTFSSFFGSPLAGILAAALIWQSVFTVSSVILAVMAVATFIFLTLFEKRGMITYGKYKPKEKGTGNIRVLIERRIVKFSFISILTGIVRTSVVFWLPTYISQYLDFSAENSALIFTVATLVISTSAFITAFVYGKIGHSMDKTVLLMFIISMVAFALVYFIKQPVFNIVLMVLAIMGANCASSVLWSLYCPSLRDTGMVSGATGFLDFLSYMAAAAANAVFANAATSIGWGNLILVWFALMALGVIISLPFKHKTNQTV